MFLEGYRFRSIQPTIQFLFRLQILKVDATSSIKKCILNPLQHLVRWSHTGYRFSTHVFFSTECFTILPLLRRRPIFLINCVTNHTIQLSTGTNNEKINWKERMSGGENSDSAETVQIFQVPSTEWIYIFQAQLQHYHIQRQFNVKL